jgi:predicted O-methyltransferase YrrM
MNMTKEEILELVLSLGSNHLEVFGGRYVGGKKIQQVPEEITEVLYTLKQLNADIKNYAEIGSAGGGTTSLFDEVFKLENAFIVDDNLHDDHRERPEILKDVKNVYEYIGDSQSSEARKFVESFNIPLDLLFIDADHSYNGVKNDTFNYISLVRKGGFILYHDTVSYSGVKQHVKEMQEDKDNFKLIIDTGTKCGLALFQKL